MIVNKKTFIFTVLTLTLTFCLQAQIYYYKDNNNNLMFTNTPNDKRAKPVKRNSFLVEPNVARKIFNQKYGGLLTRLCYQLNVNRKLVESIIEVESNFNAWSVSHKGARGLMQLMPNTAKIYGVKNIFDVRQNLTGGIKHLKYLLQVYNNDLDLALAAYNAGGEAVKKYGGIPPYRETRNYVKKVKRLYYGRSFSYNSMYSNKNRTKTNPTSNTFYKYIDRQGKTHYTSLRPRKKSCKVIKFPTK